MSEATEKFRQAVRAIDNKLLLLVPDFKAKYDLDPSLRDDILKHRMPEQLAIRKKFAPAFKEFEDIDLPGLRARGLIPPDLDYIVQAVLNCLYEYRVLSRKPDELAAVVFDIENLSERDLRPTYAQALHERARTGGEDQYLERQKLMAEEALARLARQCPTVVFTPKPEPAEEVLQRQLRRIASQSNLEVRQSFKVGPRK